MMNARSLILFVAVATSFGSGCIFRSTRAYVPGSRMDYREAVGRGTDECRSRGYDCGLKEAHATGNGRWMVKFAVYRPNAKGHLHLEYDAFSRALIRADEKVKAKGGKGHDRDDDDDDDDHGRGRGHAKHDD